MFGFIHRMLTLIVQFGNRTAQTLTIVVVCDITSYSLVGRQYLTIWGKLDEVATVVSDDLPPHPGFFENLALGRNTR